MSGCNPTEEILIYTHTLNIIINKNQIKKEEKKYG
jgi:hypothetical protein